MNPEKKNALFSITFYVISILIIAAINFSGKFKSGPCTPNLDVFSVFIVIVINVILLIVNGVRGFLMEKQTKFSFLIHLIVLLSWIICIKYRMI
ncbi:hypothetical protein [Flavobacterium sp.]|uniref:hypothetical protein n=1 Tax=Flavobacterium sp. TaxID=239 RepID=UPI0025F12157|nr:hypothetical protein [Flavobacterium sp.]